jgi:ribosomal protein L11 methyltransferase
MYSLWLACKPEEADLASAELWDEGTVGIRELEEECAVTLIASFQNDERKSQILTRFAAYSPRWIADEAVNWEAVSRDAWPGREVGSRFFVVPYWHATPKISGRLRLIHNPGLACGTVEHRCTQLALIALEKFVRPGTTVIDIGTGSGILAIAALRLGAARAIGIDVDSAALKVACENFELNELSAELVCGSADALAPNCSDLTIANISATVLLAIWEDLLLVTRRPGRLILTGFEHAESKKLEELLPRAEVFQLDGWGCLAATVY